MNKYLNILAFSLLFSLNSQSQQLLHIKHSCSFDGIETETEHYIDEPSKEANQIVEKIMRVNVLPQNFILKAANCKNALATTEGVNRYILYSTTFLENFKKEAKTQWAAYCVLAHEIGHHLSNHNLSEGDDKKSKIQELQADKYAGGVLFRLGATLAEAQAGIQTFALSGETKTHPSKTARLEAVAQGWKQAQETQGEVTPKSVVPPQTNTESKFTEVSEMVIPTKIIGKWATGDAIYRVIDISANGLLVETSKFKVSNTVNTISYKWTYSDKIFKKEKIFPNGSLGSAEFFSIEFKNDYTTLIMKVYNRWGLAGDTVTWTKVQ